MSRLRPTLTITKSITEKPDSYDGESSTETIEELDAEAQKEKIERKKTDSGDKKKHRHHHNPTTWLKKRRSEKRKITYSHFLKHALSHEENQENQETLNPEQKSPSMTKKLSSPSEQTRGSKRMS